jgi:hypothetical protein
VKSSQVKMANHIEIFHTGAACELCDTLFPSRELLRKHKSSRHHKPKMIQPGQVWECSACGKKYKSNSAINKHIRSNHKNVKEENLPVKTEFIL